MKIIYNIISFVFLTKNLFGFDFHDFDAYQHKLTTTQVEIKIKSYLEKDPSIRKFYRLTSDILYIGDWESQQIDYVLYLANISQDIPSHHRSHESLKNVKIAIDPGHFGGTYAELEQRFVNIPANQTKNGQPISFNEGTLTFLTATILKKKLEAEGAIVFMTRSKIGEGAIKESFFEWLEKHPEVWKSDKTLSDIFRNFYNREDLRLRARNINTFSPDITIVIHYNAHLKSSEKNQKAILTESNFNLVFIPGAFCANELNTVEDRYEFLRLIVKDDIEQSCVLSEQILRQFVDKLNVPVLPEDEKTSYTENTCLKLLPGVYSRNLSLTRLIHSPICYGETLIQNNAEEIYRLSANEINVEEIPSPKRVEEVAQAYFEGIKRYFHSSNCN